MKVQNIRRFTTVLTGTFEIATPHGVVEFDYVTGDDGCLDICNGFEILPLLTQLEKEELWELAEKTFDNI